MSILQRVEGPGDAELISAVRGGDLSAYGALFERHVAAARRLARQLVPYGDVDDLVSDAFAKVLTVLQRGGGPDVAFRAYLLTAVRRLHVDRVRAGTRLTTTDDLAPFDPGVPFRDTAVEGFESAAAAKAFASLPERWQLVLWHTEVEGSKPAEVATLLGMSPNSVSALAYRAREGLRQAFLNEHVSELDEDDHRWTHQHLGAYVRNGLSKRDVAKIEGHLQECRKCMAVYLELTEVNSNLSGILAPLLLGTAGSAYLAATLGSGAVAKGGLLVLLDRAKDVAVAHTAGTVASSAAVVAVTVGGVVGVTTLAEDEEPVASQGGPISVQADPDGGFDVLPPLPTLTVPASPRPSEGPGQTASDSPSELPSDLPTDATALPSDLPSDLPTDPTELPTDPSDLPTDPTDVPTDPTDVPTDPVNTAPTPTDDEATTPPGLSVTVDVLANDIDPDGDPLTVESWTAAAHGSVTAATPGGDGVPVPGDGTLVYTPDGSWAGQDSVVYTVTDGNGNRSEGTLRVTTENAPPTAQDDTAATARDTEVAIGVLGNDSDPNIPGTDQALQPGALSSPAKGAVSVNGDGTVGYRPFAGTHGVDRFTYQVFDGAGGSDEAEVVVAVDNQAPLALADDATTDTDAPVFIDVLGNDTDTDADTLMVASVWGQREGATVDRFEHSVVYTPPAGFAGVDVFYYAPTDGATTSLAPGIVLVTVRNAPPVAGDDRGSTSAGVPVDINLSANDVDANIPGTDQVLSRSVADPPGHGQVSIADGIATYVPDAGFSGVDTFSYTLTDGIDTDTGLVTVFVGNSDPVATDDQASTSHDTTVTLDVLANDSDADGDPLTITSLGQPHQADGTPRGTAAVVAGQVEYDPPAGFSGTVTFGYTIADGRGGGAGAVITVTVGNAAPQARDDDLTVTAAADGSTLLDVLANDSDPDGDALTLTDVRGRGDASVTVVGDRVRWDYPADLDGGDTVDFTYTVSDGDGESDSARVRVTLRNDAPTAVDDTVTAAPGEEVVLDVLANDTDANGDALVLESVEGPAFGDARIENGRVVYSRPLGEAAGAESFRYTVEDARGAETDGTITATVG